MRKESFFKLKRNALDDTPETPPLFTGDVFNAVCHDVSDRFHATFDALKNLLQLYKSYCFEEIFLFTENQASTYF